MIRKAFALDIEERFAPAKFADIGTFINLLIPLIYILAAILLLFIGIKGAYTILTAGENAEKLNEARELFYWLIVGFVLILCSVLIVRIIGIVFKLDLPL